MSRQPAGSPRLAAVAALAALAAGCGMSWRGDQPDAAEQPAEQPAEAEDEVGGRLAELYEKAKEAGRPLAEDALEWTREDLERIGDWQYKVVSLPALPDGELEARLDELGEERWEVFWVERHAGGRRLFLKRPARSYLRAVKDVEPWRFIRPGDPSPGE